MTAELPPAVTPRSIAYLLLILAAVSTAPVPAGESTPPQAQEGAAGEPAAVPLPSRDEYELLQRKVIAGQATMAEVRRALTDPDIGFLTNTVHGLYSMRWHRGVYNLLHDLWALKRDDYPELQWRQFEKPPVRLALASTLLRTEPFEKNAYVDYLREHKADAHEFHRAQVAVGLGFNGDADDVAWIEEMAGGDNPFVAQSAITALGLMARPQARDALIRLQERFREDGREPVIANVLKKGYNWPESSPATEAPGSDPAKN